MKLRPIGPKVVVFPIAESDRTEGGLYKPENARGKSTRGKVVAVGTGRVLPDGTRVPIDLAEGDVVIFTKYGGTEVVVNGETCVVLDENEIVGVVEE